MAANWQRGRAHSGLPNSVTHCLAPRKCLTPRPRLDHQISRCESPSCIASSRDVVGPVACRIPAHELAHDEHLVTPRQESVLWKKKEFFPCFFGGTEEKVPAGRMPICSVSSSTFRQPQACGPCSRPSALPSKYRGILSSSLLGLCNGLDLTSPRPHTLSPAGN